MVLEVSLIALILVVVILSSCGLGAYIYHRGIKVSFLRDNGYAIPEAPKAAKKRSRRIDDNEKETKRVWAEGT